MLFLRRNRDMKKQEYTGRRILHETEPLTEITGGGHYDRETPGIRRRGQPGSSHLDLQHHLLKGATRGNYLAALNPLAIHQILDIACGSGEWCIEMAQTFPEAQIIGLDLAQQAASGREIPLNCQFIQGNALMRFPFADNTFDYVHQRHLIMGVPVSGWTTEIQELLRVTRPGGILELCEASAIFTPAGKITQTWCEWEARICQSRGLNPNAAPGLETFARMAGLRETLTYYFDLPIGDWHGELRGYKAHLGNMMLKELQALHRQQIRFFRQAGMDESVARDLPELLEEEWAQLHTHLRYFVVVGRKARQDQHAVALLRTQLAEIT